MNHDFRRSLIGLRVAATDRFLAEVAEELAARHALREAQLAALHQDLEGYSQDIKTIEQAIHQHEQTQSALRSTLTLLSEHGVRKVQDAQTRMTQDDAQRMAILAKRESMLSHTGRLMEEFRAGVMALIEKTLAALSASAPSTVSVTDLDLATGSQSTAGESPSTGAVSQGE